MNKLLIFFLVVCLVSVHAFVRRDAPAAPAEKNQLEQMGDQLKELAENFKKNFDAAKIQEQVQEGLKKISEDVQKGLESFKSKPEEPKQ